MSIHTALKVNLCVDTVKERVCLFSTYRCISQDFSSVDQVAFLQSTSCVQCSLGAMHVTSQFVVKAFEPVHMI